VAASIQALLKAHDPARSSLIPILQDVQKKLGYISQGAVKSISRYLGESENEIFGVATFYTQFRFTPPGDHSVKICRGTACHVRGCERLMAETVRQLGIEPGGTTKDRRFDLESVACFGSCALSPVVVVNEKVHGRMTPQKVRRLLKRMR
jgi:NADH-quinone oxidoreductase subunit E